MWTVEVGDPESGSHVQQLASKLEVFPYVEGVARREAAGRLCADEDVGESSWFTRKILRMNRRIQAMRFAIEWSEGICSLIFFDDAASEYRAIDPESTAVASEVVRKQIAHGEVEPHPESECFPLDRGLKAIEQFLTEDSRPDWLEYRFVR